MMYNFEKIESKKLPKEEENKEIQHINLQNTGEPVR